MPGKQEWKQKETHYMKQKKTKLLLQAALTEKIVSAFQILQV